MIAEYLEYRIFDEKVKALEIVCIEAAKNILKEDLQKCVCKENVKRKKKKCKSIVHKHSSFYF